MTRREFSIAAMTAALVGSRALAPRTAMAAEGEFEITRTQAEWQAMLSDAQYRVMREEGTERSGSSPLDKIYDAGTYSCRGCEQALFLSEHKFDSGTGWPSFYQPLPDAVETMQDRRLLSVRTEVHCDRCGSHLGHVFDDGPAPTGLRYCLNGVSLVFQAA